MRIETTYKQMKMIKILKHFIFFKRALIITTRHTIIYNVNINKYMYYSLSIFFSTGLYITQKPTKLNIFRPLHIHYRHNCHQFHFKTI